MFGHFDESIRSSGLPCTRNMGDIFVMVLATVISYGIVSNFMSIVLKPPYANASISSILIA